MSQQEKLNYFINLADEYWPNQYQSDSEKLNAIAKELNLPNFDELQDNISTKQSSTNTEEDDDSFIKPIDYKINTDFIQQNDMAFSDWLAKTYEDSEEGSWGKWMSDLGKSSFNWSIAGDAYAIDSGHRKYDIVDVEEWNKKTPHFIASAASFFIGMASGPDILNLMVIPKIAGGAANLATRSAVSTSLFQKGKQAVVSRFLKNGNKKGQEVFTKAVELLPGGAQGFNTFGAFGFQSAYSRDLAEQKIKATEEGEPERDLDRWSAIKKASPYYLKEGAVGAVLFGSNTLVEKSLGKLALVKNPTFKDRIKTVALDLGKRPLEAGEMATMHSLYNKIEHGEWYGATEWAKAFGTNYAIISTLGLPSTKSRFKDLKTRLKYMKDADVDNSARVLQTYNSLEADFAEIGNLLELKEFKSEYMKKHLKSKTEAESANIVMELVDKSLADIGSGKLKGITPEIYNTLLLGRQYSEQFANNINKYVNSINKRRAKENKKPLTEKEIISLKELAQNDVEQFDLILDKLNEYTKTNKESVLEDMELDKARESEIGKQEYIKKQDSNYEFDKDAPIYELEQKRISWEEQKGSIELIKAKAEEKAKELKKAAKLKGALKGADAIQLLILKNQEKILKQLKEGDKKDINKDIKGVTDIKVTRKPIIDVSGVEIKGNIGGKKGKFIHEALADAKVSPSNRKKITVGFSKFMSVNKAKPAEYAKVLEFFEFTKNKAIEKITRQDFIEFLESKNIQSGTNKRMAYNLAITKFFGAGTKTAGGADVRLGRTGGFAHEYMIKGEGIGRYIERIADSGTYGGQQIDPSGVTRILPGKKGWGKVRASVNKNIKVNIKNKKEGNIENVNPHVVKVMVDMFYNFGNRGVDLFKHEGLLIEKINWNAGIIKKWRRSTKKAGGQTKPQQNINIKDNFPKLWEAMVKAKGDRKRGNLLIDNKNNRITERKFDNILEKIISEDVAIEAGGKGKFGKQDFRRMIERDALEIAAKEGIDPNTMMTMVNNWLTGRQPKNTQQIYLGKYQTLWPEFIKARKKFESTVTSEKISEAKLERQKEKQDIEPPEPPKTQKKTKLKQEKEKQTEKTVKQIADDIKADKESQRSFSKIIKKGGDKYKDTSNWKANVHKASEKIKQLEFQFPDEAKQLSEFRKWINKTDKKFGKKVGDLDIAKELFHDAKKYKADIIESTKDLAGTVRRRFYGLAENKFKLKSATDKNRLKVKIALMAQLPNPYEFSWKNQAIIDGRVTEGHLLQFLNRLDKLSPTDKKNLKRSVSIFEKVSDLESFRLMATKEGNPITDKTHYATLELLRIPKNNLYLATESQLQRYATMLVNEGFNIEKRGNLFETIDIQKISKDSKKDRIALERAGRRFQGAEEILKKHLGEKNVKRFYAHAAAKTGYVGLNSKFEIDAMRILGGVVKKVKGENILINQDFAETNPITRRHFHKYKDLFRFNNKLLRKEIYDAKLKVNGKAVLSMEQRNFIKKAFNKDGGYRNDTVEGHAMRKYNEYMKVIENNFKEIIQSEFPPNLAKKIIDNVKFLEQYAHLEVSENYLQHFHADHDPQQKMLHQLAAKKARALAKKKYGDKITKNQEKEFLMEGIEKANIEIVQRRRYGLGRIDIHAFKERIDNLSMKFTSPVDGKEYLTYISKDWYDASHKKYIYTMAQNLANLEFFPEVMNISGKTHADYRATLNKLMKTPTSNKETAQIRDYLTTVIERILGVGTESRPLYGGTDWMTTLANVHARTVLSGPLKGIKNQLIGNPMAALSFGTANFLLSVTQTFRSFNRDMVKAGGHTEAGMREYRLPVKVGTKEWKNSIAKWTDKGVEALFWTGFMKPAENLNRYTAVFSSLIEQRMLAEGMQHGDKLAKMQGERRFSDFYEATPKEINMIKKMGLVDPDMIDWSQITNPAKRIKIEREYRNMRQKFNFMSHARTHGVSMDIFVPEFAGKKVVKPMLLFKRMAYLATKNTVKGFDQALKDRAYHKIFGYLGWNLLGGATRYALMYNFLGAPAPQENSPWWNQLRLYAWMNEVGGLASELLSPYFGNNSRSTVTPFILENVYQGIMLTASVVPTQFREALPSNVQEIMGAEQTYTLKRAAVTYTKKTVGLFNDFTKLVDNRESPFNAKWQQYNKWYYDYLDNTGKSPSGEFKRTEQNMYFKEMKRFFLKGNKEEFAKIYSTLTYHMYEKYLEDWRDEETAWKKTISQMKRYIKSLSPIRASAEYDEFILSRRGQYLLSLPKKQQDELLKFEDAFKYRMNEYLMYTNEYWDEHKIKELSSKYNFKKRDIYKLLK